MIMNQFGIVQSLECDVFLEEVVTHPHGQDQPYITNAVNRKNFYSIFHRQVTLTIKSNQQERRYAQHFPPDKQRFHITRQHDEIVADVEKQNRIKESFVTSLTVHVI